MIKLLELVMIFILLLFLMNISEGIINSYFKPIDTTNITVLRSIQEV